MTRAEIDEILRRSSGAQADRHGGNSAVTRVEFGGGVFAVKDYSARHDGAQRMAREFNSLLFLERYSLSGFARSVVQDESSQRAVYTWLPGVRPELDRGTVGSMLGVLDRLHQLADEPGAHAIGLATDSACTPADILRQVRERVKQLSGSANAAVHELLVTDIASAQDLLGAWAQDLGVPVMTLSLSDIGPHNMLWDEMTGTMYCVDLEFFGRDDATKLVCDALLHPQSNWTTSTAEAFVEGSIRVFGLPIERIWVYLPYYSLKWALIALARAQRDLGTQAGSVSATDSGPRALDLARRYAQRANEIRTPNPW